MDYFEQLRKFTFYPDGPGTWHVARQGNTLFHIREAEGKFQVEDVRLPEGPNSDEIKQFDTIDAAAGYVVGLLTIPFVPAKGMA